MKLFYQILALLFILCIILSCEKGEGDYRMEDGEFLVAINQHLLYQRHLDDELSRVSLNQSTSQLAISRKLENELYLSEIKSMTTLWPSDTSLSDSALKNLQTLGLSQSGIRDKLLLKLIVLSDEDLIGLHVKASGPVGLKNAKLRVWTEDKLVELRQKLNQSQILWNSL